MLQLGYGKLQDENEPGKKGETLKFLRVKHYVKVLVLAL